VLISSFLVPGNISGCQKHVCIYKGVMFVFG